MKFKGKRIRNRIYSGIIVVDSTMHHVPKEISLEKKRLDVGIEKSSRFELPGRKFYKN